MSKRILRTRLYFLGLIPQGIWEGEFDKRGVRWWARPFMRYAYDYACEEVNPDA